MAKIEMTTQKLTTHTIDAQGKKLGRVASQAALFLMGKDSPDFERHLVAAVHVTIINAAKLDMTAKKKQQKVYTYYSGYPGGLRTETLAQHAASKGMSDVLKMAIYGMLSSNRLRARMMKNLVIQE